MAHDSTKTPKHIDIALGDNNPFALNVVNTLGNGSSNGNPIVASLVNQPTLSNVINIDADGDGIVVTGTEPTGGAEITVTTGWLNASSEAVMKGIYKFDGDKLTYCFAAPNAERPTEFAVKKGSGHTLTQLQQFKTGEEQIEIDMTAAGASHFVKDDIGWITSFSILNSNADEILEVATGLKKLSRITIKDSFITGKGFQSLAEMSPLNEIRIHSDTEIAGISKLRTLSSLSGITLSGKAVDDAVIDDMHQLNLRRLSISQASISSAAVDRLIKTQDGLTRLDITSCGISDAAIKSLDELRTLTTLSLARTKITDDGLAVISQLSQLTGLLIYNTEISDRGFEHLRSLSKLGFLRIDGTQVTDKSLRMISQSFPELRTLYIRNLPGTDQGLLELAKHPKLQEVHISKENFSAAAIKRVRKARKDLRLNAR